MTFSNILCYGIRNKKGQFNIENEDFRSKIGHFALNSELILKISELYVLCKCVIFNGSWKSARKFLIHVIFVDYHSITVIRNCKK